MLYRKFITLAFLSFDVLGTPGTISESTVSRGAIDSSNSGDLTKDGSDGTYLSIVDVSSVSLTSLTVDTGNSFYVTVVNALSSIVNLSGLLNNSGTVAFLTGISYNLAGTSFQNNGGSSYFVGSGSGASLCAITTSGNICFYDDVLTLSSTISGSSGCIAANQGSTIDILSISSVTGQSFYLDSTSTLKVTIPSDDSHYTLSVEGFGSLSTITLTTLSSTRPYYLCYWV